MYASFPFKFQHAGGNHGTIANANSCANCTMGVKLGGMGIGTENLYDR
jgi:hypothetical protein